MAAERHLFRPSRQEPLVCGVCGLEQKSIIDETGTNPEFWHTNPDAKITTSFPPVKREGILFETDDPINPSHYSFTSMSAVAVSEEWGLNFRLFSVLKYIQRHERKGDPLENLKKAKWYLDREITRRENEPPRS